MQLIAPVTDYIPASTLTTRGDIVQRGAALPERLASGIFGMVHRSSGVGASLADMYLVGALNSYLKGAGLGANPTFTPLGLRDTGIHIGSGTRNIAGNQVITGVGFRPSAVIFLATDDTGANMNWSIGFDAEPAHTTLYQGSNGTVIVTNNGYSLYIDRGGGNRLMGHNDSIEADGFTISWVLFGACVVDFVYLCLP